MPDLEINPDTIAFTSALFDYVPEDRHALLWTLQDKRSTWVSLADDGAANVALSAAQLAAKNRDVYVAVSVAAGPGMFDTRIKSDNSTGIFGLWADIDIQAPDVHKKWNLPPDEQSALDLLDSAGLPPSLVVHSGHGLQAWWLFPEFWDFTSDEDRLRAAGLAQRWNTTLRVRAAERQWTVDSTFDLARVMRIPGTWNRKGSTPVPVRLLTATDKRYEADDFEPYLLDDKFLQQRGVTATRSYKPDDVELSEGAQPQFEKFQALMANDPMFEATWNRKRKDMLDQSPSSYDLSLVYQAARAGWTDQECAALMLAFRRQHKLDIEKAMRLDYVKRTIAKARDSLAREDATEMLEDIADAIDEARQTGDDDDVRGARRNAHEALGQTFNIEIVQIIKYTSDPPSYRLVTPVASVDLGGSENILRHERFLQRLWDGLEIQIGRFKQPAWDRITATFLKAVEHQDVGLEATDRGEMYSWLTQYLGSRPPVDTLEEAAQTEYPFINGDGRTVIFGPAFRRWIYITYQERITNKDMGKRLRSFGCDPDKVNVEDDAGKRTTRSVWLLPKDGLR